MFERKEKRSKGYWKGWESRRKGRQRRKSQKGNSDFRKSTVAQKRKCGAYLTHTELWLMEMFFHTLLVTSLLGLDS